MSRGIWDLSSLARDVNRCPCAGSVGLSTGLPESWFFILMDMGTTLARSSGPLE